jgi:hypothetical protein
VWWQESLGPAPPRPGARRAALPVRGGTARGVGGGWWAGCVGGGWCVVCGGCWWWVVVVGGGCWWWLVVGADLVLAHPPLPHCHSDGQGSDDLMSAALGVSKRRAPYRRPASNLVVAVVAAPLRTAVEPYVWSVRTCGASPGLPRPSSSSRCLGNPVSDIIGSQIPEGAGARPPAVLV